MSKNTVKPTLTRQRRTSARRRRQATPAMVALQLLVRFLSGRPLDGRRHSNGTFWAAGTRRVGPPAYLITCQWWALAAGWQRLGVRLTGVMVGLLALSGVIR
ncbi:hypothetical protein [Actinoplanes xinjiangensis]|uniref:hypothetical protein n=1 Tax=Actinoplanes xinjiangensis TaxID=512350 RepID=UPI00341C99A4